MKRSIRVAVSQRICPPWRVPFFRMLAQRPGLDLTLLYGRGTAGGAAQNDPCPTGFKSVLLPTVSCRYQEKAVEKYRSLHPTLLFHLFAGRYDVVVVEPFTDFGNDLLARLYASLSGSAFVWTDVGEPPDASRLRRLFRPVISAFIRSADACVALNNIAARDFRRWGVPPERVFLAPNAIDTGAIRREIRQLRGQRAGIRAGMGLTTDEFVVLFVGAIERRKRVDLLLEAIALLRDEGLAVRAVVVGDGSYLEELKRTVPMAETRAVRFEGSHYADVARYFAACDLVVLPGQGGLTINQALACGIPCVATRDAVGGGETVSDYILDGVNGLIVPANDACALAAAIGGLVANPARFKRLQHGAAQSADAHSLDAMVAGFEEAIHFAQAHCRLRRQRMWRAERGHAR